MKGMCPLLCRSAFAMQRMLNAQNAEYNMFILRAQKRNVLYVLQEMYSHHFLPFHKALNFLVCKTLLHCMCTFYNSNNYNCLGIFGWLRYFTKYHQKKSITSVILNNGLKTVRTSVSENCLLQPTKWLFLFYTVFHVSFSKSKWL